MYILNIRNVVNCYYCIYWADFQQNTTTSILFWFFAWFIHTISVHWIFMSSLLFTLTRHLSVLFILTRHLWACIYDTNMPHMTPTCHLWHQHDTYGTNMTPMAPTWHLGHQHGTYGTSMTLMPSYGTSMSLMTPACNLWHQHVTYGTNMALMAPTWHLWHQHVTYMTPTWHLWHHHVTYDTSMSPMAPACNLRNHDDTHVTYDTDMASMTHCPGAGKRRFWWKTMAQYGTVCSICHPHLTMTYMLCHPWHHDGTHVTYDTDMESMTPSWQQWHHTVLSWERTILV